MCVCCAWIQFREAQEPKSATPTPSKKTLQRQRAKERKAAEKASTEGADVALVATAFENTSISDSQVAEPAPKAEPVAAKLRTLRKTLKQIEKLEEAQQAGTKPLSEAEQKKITKKEGVLKEIAELEARR